MAKRGMEPAALSGHERVQGGILLICYLAVFPVLAGRGFGLLELLAGVSVGSAQRDLIYYWVLFALTLAVFRKFWKKTTKALLSGIGNVLVSLGLGLPLFYGLGWLSAKALRLLPLYPANLNDAAISAQLGTSPGRTVLMVVFLAPVVEETLFRGYVFGTLRERGRTRAYLVSCLLWGLAHVWQYAAGDWSYLLLMAQYLVPGLVMAWTYERAGSLWGSVLLHSIVNALAVWSVL